MFFIMSFVLLFAFMTLICAWMTIWGQKNDLGKMDCEIQELTAAYQEKDRQLEYIKKKIAVHGRVHNKLLNELQKDLEVQKNECQ